MCGKKQHTKAEIRSEMSELICGRIAAGENYNLTRDNLGYGFNVFFLDKAEVTKEENTLDFMKLKTLCFKGHQWEYEKAHRMGEHICKS